MSYWGKSKLSKRVHNFAVYQLCAFVSIINPVAVDLSLYKTLKDQFNGIKTDACKRIAELVEENKRLKEKTWSPINLDTQEIIRDIVLERDGIITELLNLCNEMMPYIEKWAMEKYRFDQQLNEIEK